MRLRRDSTSTRTSAAVPLVTRRIVECCEMGGRGDRQGNWIDRGKLRRDLPTLVFKNESIGRLSIGSPASCESTVRAVVRDQMRKSGRVGERSWRQLRHPDFRR